MRLSARFAVIVLALSAALSCATFDRYTGEDVNRQVRKKGVKATAEVLEIWDTGVRLNDNPVVGFRLQVKLDDGKTYQAEAKNVVSIVHLSQVQPGAILPVMVDPLDPERVALDIQK